MQFCTANGKTQKGALQAMRTKVHTVFSPVKIVPVLPVLRQISSQTGVCIFVRSKKNFTKSVCNGVKRLERVGQNCRAQC